MDETLQKQLAADIAANVVKAQAATTARDLQIQKLELNYQSMFDVNTKEHNAIVESVDKMTSKMDEMITKMDEKYASKWVEKLLITIGGVIGLSLLTYLGTLIYKATLFFK